MIVNGQIFGILILDVPSPESKLIWSSDLDVLALHASVFRVLVLRNVILV